MMKRFSFAHFLGRSKPRAEEAPPEEEDDDEAEDGGDEEDTKEEKAEGDPDPEDKSEEDTDAEKADAPATPVNAAAEIVHLCTEAGRAHLASPMLKLGLTVDQVKERLAGAKEIGERVAAAHRACPAISEKLADDFVIAGTPADEASKALVDLMVSAQSPEIKSTHASGDGPTGARNFGWGKAVEKRNALNGNN